MEAQFTNSENNQSEMKKRRLTTKQIQKRITDILEFIGEDVSREGLLDTPSRIVRSWDRLYGGYNQDPAEILKTTFKEGSCDEMVILKNIEFYSTCEHHMLPFFGSISIGYLPDKKVVGVSKLARLVECFSRRMQIQERMTKDIADCIMNVLGARGVMVVCEAKHLCMVARGVEKQNSVMVTSAVRGVFKDDAVVRNEFLKLIEK